MINSVHVLVVTWSFGQGQNVTEIIWPGSRQSKLFCQNSAYCEKCVSVDDKSIYIIAVWNANRF